MTKKQWFKQLKRELGALSASDRNEILQYYDELYNEKRESGLTEEAVLGSFGAPQEAARGILAERDLPAASAREHRSVASFLAILFLFLCIGIPILSVLFALAITAGALAVSGAAIFLAGIADGVWFCILLFRDTPVATLAHIGIGLAGAGCGLLMIPLFAVCTKWMLALCKKSLLFTGKLLTGKRSM